MEIIRTRFKKDIVAEVGIPSKKSVKVMILCPGMPSVPSKKALIEFWAKKGYFVIYPRYRGTWESSGRFLKQSPHEDILDILDELPKGIIDIWSGKKYHIKPRQIYVIGSSFGGPAGILVSRDKRVTKVIAVSPVVDYRVRSKTESFGKLYRLLREGFSGAYRFSKKDWDKLKTGKFYNPIAYVDKVSPSTSSGSTPSKRLKVVDGVDGKKIFIIHAKDDEVVSYKPSVKFSKKTGARLLLLRRGGHAIDITRLSIYKKVSAFLRE